jgi:hypothetical protein
VYENSQILPKFLGEFSYFGLSGGVFFEYENSPKNTPKTTTKPTIFQQIWHHQSKNKLVFKVEMKGKI